VLFTVHEGAPCEWRLAVDTAHAEAACMADSGCEPEHAPRDYVVQPPSVVVSRPASA